MRVLVIGATGGTGKHLVRQLLALGHEVTAFARTPSAVTETNERLRIAQGDARDGGSIDRAVEGHDAVMVAFGPRSLKRDDLQEVFMKHLLTALDRHSVKRVINLSAWGVLNPGAVPTPFFFRYIFRPLVLRHIFVDKERAEALLLASPLDFVNVQPGRLLDSPARGAVRASLDGRGLRPEMTRADLATFMIEQLTSNDWLRKSVVVGY